MKSLVVLLLTCMGMVILPDTQLELDYQAIEQLGDTCSLSEEEIVNIATLHNQILPSAIQNMEGRSLEDLYSSYRAYLRSNYPEGYKSFNLDVRLTQELFTFSVAEFSFSRKLSKEFRGATQKAVDVVLEASSLEDLERNLDKLLRSSLVLELNECELMAIQVFAEVAKKSAVYWIKGNQGMLKWDFGKFICADALGAYSGFVGSAVLAPVPGANATIAVAATFGAVWGSASYSMLGR